MAAHHAAFDGIWNFAKVVRVNELEGYAFDFVLDVRDHDSLQALPAGWKQPPATELPLNISRHINGEWR